jgi:large repetitive protein
MAGIALLALAGCSSKTTSPTGTGDISGLRLGTFASNRGGSSGYDIYLWDYDAGAFKSIDAIRSTADETHPTLSSDGRFIAFQVNRGSGGSDIEMFDRKGPAFIDLTPLNTAAEETEPAFSGDGKLLCYTQGSGVGRRVRLFDGVNGVPLALPGLDTTGANYADYSPSPNHDASLIAFVSTRDNKPPHIYIYDRTRHVVLRGPSLVNALEQGANQDVDPSFSQSGRFLAFASDRSGTGSVGGLDVYVLEFVTNVSTVDTVLRVMPAANSPNEDRHPSISDTGNSLVFQSDRALGSVGGIDLYNFDRTTGTLTHPVPPLTYNSTANDIEPSLKWPY